MIAPTTPRPCPLNAALQLNPSTWFTRVRVGTALDVARVADPAHPLYRRAVLVTAYAVIGARSTPEHVVLAPDPLDGTARQYVVPQIALSPVLGTSVTACPDCPARPSWIDPWTVSPQMCLMVTHRDGTRSHGWPLTAAAVAAIGHPTAPDAMRLPVSSSPST